MRTPWNVQTALRYVNEAHQGYFAFVTADGFVFRGEAVYPRVSADGVEREDGDRVCEDFEVFPVINGCVDGSALRAHMGY